MLNAFRWGNFSSISEFLLRQNRCSRFVGCKAKAGLWLLFRWLIWECPAWPGGREGLASASPLRRPLRHHRRAKGAALSRVPAGRAHRPSRGPRPRPPARRPVPGAGALCARVDRPAGQGPLSFTHVRAVLSKRETCGSCSLLVNLWILQDRGWRVGFVITAPFHGLRGVWGSVRCFYKVTSSSRTGMRGVIL